MLVADLECLACHSQTLFWYVVRAGVGLAPVTCNATYLFRNTTPTAISPEGIKPNLQTDRKMLLCYSLHHLPLPSKEPRPKNNHLIRKN